jgi:hypothetical protein
MAGGWRQPPIPPWQATRDAIFPCESRRANDDPCRQAPQSRREWIGTMTIKDPELDGEDLLAFEIADEALEAAAEKAKPAFTLIGSPTVSVLVACCG